MSVSQTMETEEDLLTCLQVKFFHPQQHTKSFYGLLPLGQRSRHSADEPLRLGRDAQSCTFALMDPRVSRKLLSFQAFRTPQSPEMLFTVQNLSQRGRLTVNGHGLGYLERKDLPDKALIRFGEYEMLVIRDSGEAKGSFEMELEVLAVSPSREMCLCVPSMTPIMDTGFSPVNNFPDEADSGSPLETDETLMCQSG